MVLLMMNDDYDYSPRAHLVSDAQSAAMNTPIKINQDANIFVTEVEAGREVDFMIEQGRQAYLLCIEGVK